ncbi:hypothetical protein QOZ80_6BG0503270 [Eleusine coracana subsp. coracana]|nr:hypothetical protein QOZ80_6BG0503270 [Eleusine coracana subsp. coracana]
MASSCIPAGIRLDLEMMKAAAAGAAPPRPAHSAPSSTLSEASNASSSSTSSLSLKRPRTPRKRPNQTYNEAAALLASMYPSVFSAAKGPDTAPPRLLGLASALADDPDCSDLLPPFPVLGHAAFLLRDLPPPTPWSPVPAKSCSSPAAVSSVFSEFRDPAPSPATPDAAAADELGELDFDDDGGFDADSFLGVDEGAAKGIDAIMGKLTMGNDAAATAATSANSYLPGSSIQSYLRNVMMLQLGFRHGQLNKSQAQALKGQTLDTKWWMCPAIPVKDIVPAQQASVQMPVVPENKKKIKKKVMEREMNIATGVCRKAEEGVPGSANGDPRTLVLQKTGLGLRLNSEEVLKAWCGRGSVFANPDLPRTSAGVLVKHSNSDIIKENVARGVIREGNILKMQHKQKQCTPVVSNKSRYYRPRVKGRFVSKAYLLQQAAEKEREG